MSYIPAGQDHSDEEFDALYEAKGKALRAQAAAQGIPLSKVRLTDAQNKAVNANARAAYQAKTGGPVVPAPGEQTAGKDNTILYVGAAAVVALLVLRKRKR